MDVKIKCEEGEFKFRVAGLLIVNEKVLTVDICDNGFYCLPGGHVHLGESSADAMLREFKEEVGIECRVGNAVALIENFFKNKKGKMMHEVCYYYLIEPLEEIETKDYCCVENDDGELKQLHFRWIDLKDADKEDFRPTILAKKLSRGDMAFEHIIFKD